MSQGGRIEVAPTVVRGVGRAFVNVETGTGLSVVASVSLG